MKEQLEEAIAWAESQEQNEVIQAALVGWRYHLDTLNGVQADGTTPTCPKGYYWNGSSCTIDVGKPQQ